ncbi:MAG: radical SAM/SPASM domain-containing protein [Elusimicrobiota bacterium]|nr:radical SAM/SPASM domain-containing protein [Elusimicrobiota bacterium]
MRFIDTFKNYVRSQARHNVILRKLLIWNRDRNSRAAQGGLISKQPFGISNVELTNKCPMRCVMCPRTRNMTRAQGFMEFAVFKSIADQYAAANPAGAATDNFWLHHFGESLLHPELGKFIRYAVSRNVKASLSVNPFLLSPEVSRDLLEAGIRVLYISLDGHDDASFERIRGVKNAFEPSKKNLLAFLKLKLELKSAARVSLSMIDFEENQESIEVMRRFWAQVPGIDEFKCKTFVTWDGEAPDVNALAGTGRDSRESRKLHSAVGCLSPWRHMTVAWDGDVLPCCFDYDKKYVLGNVKEQSLAEIWNGERMQSLRKEFLSNNVSNRLCRSCAELYPPL